LKTAKVNVNIRNKSVLPQANPPFFFLGRPVLVSSFYLYG